MSARRHLAALLGTALFLTACQSDAETPPTSGATDVASESATDNPTAPDAPQASAASRCIDDRQAVADGALGDPRDLWSCADAIVVHASEESADVAAVLAAALGGPAFSSDELAAGSAVSIDVLGASRVVTLGSISLGASDTFTVEGGPGEAFGASLFGVDLLDADVAYVAAASDASGRLAAASMATRAGLPLVVLPDAPTAQNLEALTTLRELRLVSIDVPAADVEAALRGATPAPPVEAEPAPTETPEDAPTATDAPTPANPSPSDTAAPPSDESTSPSAEEAQAPTAAVTDPGLNVVRVPVLDLASALLGQSPAGAPIAWLVDGDAPASSIQVVVGAALAGHAVLALPGADPFAAGNASARLTSAVNDGTIVIRRGGDALAPERLATMLRVLAAGNEAPGGGYTLTGKRFIAMYGTPGTSSLGVLGEQNLDATVDRLRKIAAPYDDGTLTVVPTFEIIATVASASATENGDYSYGISHDIIREWVDRAAEEGFKVILDLQSGRTDFLTQVKELDEFLKQPHVGVALDPEWRLKPDQVHLRQIGSVTGAEVNSVVDHLAALVRDNDLPQKMLVLHQFNLSMIKGRDEITTPDEILVVLHMDGQGSLGAKYGTYGTLFDAGQPQAQGMFAGWKNFYDEDIPMANPAQVLALEPQPVFITFQ